MREIEELLKFIKNSPSMFHTIETISKELKAAGFQYLPETRDWKLKTQEEPITRPETVPA